MKNERILSYGLSNKITENDINSISGAASSSFTTTYWSAHASGGPGNWDGGLDVTIDF